MGQNQSEELKRFRIGLRRYIPGVISRIVIYLDAFGPVDAVRRAEESVGCRFEAAWTEIAANGEESQED